MKPHIRVFRKQQGLTQQELADAVGCRRSALSEWETGTRCVPHWHLWKLARCLHVTVDALYDDGYEDSPTTADEQGAPHA